MSGALLPAACSAPKYAHYTSIWGDWKAEVPWGWKIVTESQENRYSNTSFIGPFDPNFFMGAPSLTVRWYAYNKPHRLPDGQIEVFSSADDYIKQLLRDVYQPHQTLIRPVADFSAGDLQDGRTGKHFVVSSPTRVPGDLKWGIVLDAATGQPYNVREHAYAVVSLKTGFYALIYPATKDSRDVEGYPVYEPLFNNLVHSFRVLKEGPEGASAAKSLP